VLSSASKSKYFDYRTPTPKTSMIWQDPGLTIICGFRKEDATAVAKRPGHLS
jgi:hypothetical protein